MRAPAERMAIRSIRTAVVADDRGDQVAMRYFTDSGLDIAQTDVSSDFLTFSEGYVRVGIDPQMGKPLALRRDPKFMVTAQDPLNPNRTMAAFELLHDEWTMTDWAYLWLPGEQWVAYRQRTTRPPGYTVPGLTQQDRRWAGLSWWPRLSFDVTSFTMRPDVSEVEPQNRDDGPYSEKFADSGLMPVVRFDNRDGVGEFEEHLDLLDRINHTIMSRVIIAAIQAFKQRALEQNGSQGGSNTVDRLPPKNPDTGQDIDWDQMFVPGPDALWKLPPGVTVKELGQVDLQPILAAVQDDVKHLSAVTSTPFSMFSPDGVNQSAEGAQLTREGLVFKVEDRDRIAASRWAKVISLLFQMAPPADRYDADGNDRADASRIVLDWLPAERYSLAEKASADSQNTSLSADMAAAKIWGLTPDEVAINKAQRASDMFAAAAMAQPAASGRTAG